MTTHQNHTPRARPGCPHPVRHRIVPIVFILFAIIVTSLFISPALGQHPIGNDAFRRVWTRQDGPIADRIEPNRSWTWGPHPISAVLTEQMIDSPGGTREVQYFDKSRMEINDPTADATSLWYVTNGLLPIEMMTGRVQIGFSRFEQVSPARLSAIGDPGTFPTYANLSQLYQNPGAVSPDALNKPVTHLCQPDGTMGSQYAYQDDPATIVMQGSNGHGIPRAFLDFQNSYGTIYVNGQPAQAQVYDADFVFGMPVTPACWVTSRVGGQEQAILFQVFERRVLTYNPANEPAFRVEMGNVGQHYYRWRYEGASDPVVSPSSSATTSRSQPTQSPTTAATAAPSATATPAPMPTSLPLPTPTLTTAPTTPPSPSSAGDMSLFGMNTYFTGLERIENDGPQGIARLMSLGREAGVEWAREELSWANIEPTKKGIWNWVYDDEHILQTAQAGYGIVGVVLTTPGWARAGDCASREGHEAEYWCPPGNPQDFGDFVGAIVERYDGDGVQDAPGSPRIAAWQIWNEPSTRGTWPGTPAEYGAMLVAGYNAAKAADSSAVVVTGGIYLYDGMGTDINDGLPFLNAMIAAVPESLHAFDALAIHPYMPTSAPDAPVIFATITLWGRITTAQNWLNDHPSNRQVRPLWISEVGWSTCEVGSAGCYQDVARTEEEQANYMVRTYALAKAHGVQHVSYFQLEDKFDGATGRFWEQASIVGKGSSYRTKPAFNAYRVLHDNLHNTTYLGPGPLHTFGYDPTIENPVDLYHLRFTKPDGTLVDMLWRNAGSQTVEMPLESGRSAELITRDGNVTALSAPSARIEVSERPVYVRQR